MVKTAGGHRRLPLAGVLNFVRETGRELADPTMLGLPAMVGKGERVLENACRELTSALFEGAEEKATGITWDLYVQDRPLAVIFDEVMAKAMARIGEEWECGRAEVYQERIACEILIRTLGRLKQAIPTPRDAILAMGGAPECDHYQIPTTMVSLVLAERGYNAVSMGANIPFESLAQAIVTHRPSLFWLSVSHIDDSDHFRESLNALFDVACRIKTRLVLGGRALDEHIRPGLRYSVFCDTMQHLESFLGAP